MKDPVHVHDFQATALHLLGLDHEKSGRDAKKMKEYEKFSDRYESVIPVSIKKATTHADILDDVVKHLPEHPYLYDSEILTTEHMRDIFKEFIDD